MSSNSVYAILANMVVVSVTNPIFLVQFINKLTVAHVAEDVREFVSCLRCSTDVSIGALNLCLRVYTFTVHTLILNASI